MDTATGLLGLLLVLSTITEQATENVFGKLIDGKWIKVVAIGVGIAVTFAFWTLADQITDFAALSGLKWQAVLGAGIAVGLVGNLLHQVFNKVLPGAKSAPIIGGPDPESVLEAARKKLKDQGIVLSDQVFYKKPEVGTWITSLYESGVINNKERAAVLGEVYRLQATHTAGMPVTTPPGG